MPDPLHLKTTNPAANTLEPKIHLTNVFVGHWRKGFHSTLWIQQTALSSCPRAFSLLLPPPSCSLSKRQLFPLIILSIVASLLACRPNSKKTKLTAYSSKLALPLGWGVCHPWARSNHVIRVYDTRYFLQGRLPTISRVQML